jgi:hypothetical protein
MWVKYWETCHIIASLFYKWNWKKYLSVYFSAGPTLFNSRYSVIYIFDNKSFQQFSEISDDNSAIFRRKNKNENTKKNTQLD